VVGFLFSAHGECAKKEEGFHLPLSTCGVRLLISVGYPERYQWFRLCAKTYRQAAPVFLLLSGSSWVLVSGKNPGFGCLRSYCPYDLPEIAGE
jgi:hypothetical protein